MDIKFAPKEVFEQILEWSVIPTFDIVIEYNDKGIILVKKLHLIKTAGFARIKNV